MDCSRFSKPATYTLGTQIGDLLGWAVTCCSQHLVTIIILGFQQKWPSRRGQQAATGYLLLVHSLIGLKIRGPSHTATSVTTLWPSVSDSSIIDSGKGHRTQGQAS